MSSAWEETPASTVSFQENNVYRPGDLDEDDSNVPDNWDDEPDEPAPAPKPATTKPKPKKSDKKKEPVPILSEEQQKALKAEAEKRVREVDLELAKEMLGTKINVSDVSFTPDTPEEFDSLNVFLVSLISSLSNSSHFPEFAEKFGRDVAVALELDVLRKMSDAMSAVATEKTKIQQQSKKTKSKGKGIKLHIGDSLREATRDELFGGGGEVDEVEDEYDEMADKYDFM